MKKCLRIAIAMPHPAELVGDLFASKALSFGALGETGIS